MLTSLGGHESEYTRAFTVLELLALVTPFIQLMDMDEPGEEMLEKLISRLLSVVTYANACESDAPAAARGGRLVLKTALA